MRTYGAALLVWMAVGSSALAQNWAKEMFDHTEHNFGTVARGAKVEHRFSLENVYLEDAHIVSAVSSCGCTTPTITKRSLKTWEKADIVATIDTKSFLGNKEAAITVRFDKPFAAEVILRVSVYIRSDVVVQPGLIDFGSVAQGAQSARRVTVSYAGRADWKIEAIETSNRYLDIHAVEAGRTSGQVTYNLSVALKANTPPGYIKDQLVLVTNDANARTARVPVPIEGTVNAAITVRPSPLLLGVVSAGQSVSKPLVIQSQAPFRVLRVQCTDPRFQFKTPTDAQSVQLIPVTFLADGTTGNVTQVIHIETDATTGATLDVPVQARVMTPGAGNVAAPAEGGWNSVNNGAKNDANWGPAREEPKTGASPATQPGPLAQPSASDKRSSLDADTTESGASFGPSLLGPGRPGGSMSDLPSSSGSQLTQPAAVPAQINPSIAGPAVTMPPATRPLMPITSSSGGSAASLRSVPGGRTLPLQRPTVGMPDDDTTPRRSVIVAPDPDTEVEDLGPKRPGLPWNKSPKVAPQAAENE